MTQQRHQILRQVLQVHGCHERDVQPLQAQMRDGYYRHLLPIIERCCSQFSSPERIHRIDTLQIDLGRWPADVAELSEERIQTLVSRALTEAIKDTPAQDGELESFVYFLRTGTLPWWANRSDRDCLLKILDHVLQRPGRAVRAVILALPEQERVLQRITRAYSDRWLDALTTTLAPASSFAAPGSATRWLALLQSCGSLANGTVHLRSVWWEETLRAALGMAAAVEQAQGWLGALLARVAERCAGQYGALLTDLSLSLDEHSSAGIPVSMRAGIESLCRRAGMAPRGELRRPGGARHEDAGADAARLTTGPAKLRHTASGASAGAVDADQAQPMTVVATGRALDSPQRRHVAIEQHFSDSDVVYVENAGLVILWPFLGSFLTRSGLLQDQRFKDPSAQQRAVALTQYIACGHAASPEYLLPLNKVLCGIDPEEVADVELTPAQIQECDDLIAAVIEQAPILRKMSVQGFRSTFLLRAGQLGVRDGNWLLRVERQTHDIVLDRFPWSVQFVKLPWMQALLHVEW